MAAANRSASWHLGDVFEMGIAGAENQAALEVGHCGVESRIFLPSADQRIQIGVLHGLGLESQAPGQCLHGHRIETLAFLLGAAARGTVNRWRHSTKRVLHGLHAGIVGWPCLHGKVKSSSAAAPRRKIFK